MAELILKGRVCVPQLQDERKEEAVKTRRSHLWRPCTRTQRRNPPLLSPRSQPRSSPSAVKHSRGMLWSACSTPMLGANPYSLPPFLFRGLLTIHSPHWVFRGQNVEIQTKHLGQHLLQNQYFSILRIKETSSYRREKRTRERVK